MPMAAANKIRPVDRTVSNALRNYRPPEDLTVSQWAERYRVLSRESSAEAGPWRNDRTPYMVEPMDAFTDPRVSDIAVVAMSQVGKSEFLLNAIGYIIDQDPASTIFVQPNLDDARKFSKLRIAPMVRDSPRLREKVANVKSRDESNTTLQKSFPGGMLTIVGSQSPSALASTPAKNVLGDEVDRWALSAGSEGDPWDLATARTTTFYNAKRAAVSTPTIKGRSRIEKLYNEGTQERWCSKCPDCGEWHDIVFADIKFDFETVKVGKAKTYNIKWLSWCCPSCGTVHSEKEMRAQPAKWIARNPEALRHGRRSFWINAFSSPWRSWAVIARKFLEAKDDPQKLKVFYNTILGELWEDRGDLADEDTMLARREDYGTRADGTPVELPEGVLVLTCGVDTQDDRLEYEVVGWGHYRESWGIKKGVIYGDPNEDAVWLRLDDVLNHGYRFENGRGLKISRTFVDSGGHKTQAVYKQCRARTGRQVFAIKGSNKQDDPLTKPPGTVKIVVNGKVVGKTWLYNIGVNAAKADLLKGALLVLEPGPKYCHFPKNPEAGYDYHYFMGLLSETEEVKVERGRTVVKWNKIPGHERNEPLDIRNYAYAALVSLDPDMEAVAARLRQQKQSTQIQPQAAQKPKKKVSRSSALDAGGDW